MIGELIPTGVTFGVGRNSINTSFSGTAEFNNVALDSGADFSGGTGGGILYSGGTDLYNIFVTSSVDTTTAGNGLTKTGDNITLGGTLTGSTNIDLNSSTFSLSDTDFSIYTFATSNQKKLAISGDTNALNEFSSVSNMPLLGGFGGVAMGTIGPNAVIPGIVPERGVSGDTYIYSSARANGLNIISADNPSGTADYIRLYAGQDATGTPDIHIQGSGATRGYVGLNNDNPQELLHLKDGEFLIETSSGGPLFKTDFSTVNAPLVTFSGGSTDLVSFFVETPGVSSNSIILGVRGYSEVGGSGYGKQGDGFLYSTSLSNGLNIISHPTNPTQTTEDYIRFFAGQDATGTPDIHIQGSGATRGYVGLNNDNPQELLHTKDGDFLIETSNGKFYSDLDSIAGPFVAISGGTTGLTRMDIVADLAGGSIGVRGFSDTTYVGYGAQGDMFLYSGNDANGLNFISSLGTGTDDYIRLFAGQDANGVPDIHIQGSGATKGYVGVKNANPQYQLDINGDINASGIIYSGGTDIGTLFGAGITANNGLTKSGDNITLGGTLTGNTIIATDANEFQINAGGGAGNVLFSGDGASTEQIRFLTEFIPLEPAEITIGKGAVKMLSTSGLTSAFIAAGGAQAQITFDDGVGQRKIVAGAGNYDIHDSIGNRGINYISNYHANYENRTLVDFEYVNNHVASATTGGGGSITGTGTTSTISKWDSISGLTDSQLTDDGTNVSVYAEKIRRKTTHNFGTSGGTVNWDIDNSSNSKITLSSSLTLNISNVESGDFGTLKITQDGIGSHCQRWSWSNNAYCNC
jgi:hypothetical protein